MNGITLISLVVTIIILLILAGISIGMLSGDNGILGQAGNAKTQTDIAREKEIIDLAVVYAMGKSKYGDIDETSFTNELEKNNATVTKSGSKYKVTFTSGRQYTVDQDGNLTEYKPVPLTGITLANTVETVEIGRSKILTLTKEPTNTTESIKWISETPNVATVEETTGKVTGVAIGTAIIKATSQDGSVLSSNSCTITVTEAVSEIEKGINPETYGRVVNYNVDLGTDEDGNNLTWKVFYDDGTNVYLIASDYVQTTNSNLASTITAIGAVKSGKYNICWGNFKTYQSESTTSTIAATGSDDVFINRPSGTAYLTGRGLLSFWKDTITTSSENNAKMTACLMDTKAWSSFATGYAGAYAIGGPTLSMWVESWNAIHGSSSNDRNKAQLYYNNVGGNGKGYFVGVNRKPADYTANIISSTGYAGITNDGAKYTDNLYFPHKGNYNSCAGYFLSSPSAQTTGKSGNEMCVNHEGYIKNYTYSAIACYGVRPVVCLPSGVKISDIANETGTYDIVNK